jgi:hypothetical protein
MSALPAALVTEHARCKASANRSGRRAFLRERDENRVREKAPRGSHSGLGPA